MAAKQRADARVAVILACGIFVVAVALTGPGTVYGQETKAAEAMFKQIDSSGDGLLTMSEATVGTRSFLERIFKEAGKAPTDRVTREEFLAAYERLKSKSSATSTSKPSSASAESTSSGGAPPAGIQFIDADANGSVSRTEWSKFTQSFSKLDTDKSNSLDATELEVTGGAAELIMQLADADGNGSISRNEWIKFVGGFAKLDANKDGSLDEKELKTTAEGLVAAASGSATLPGGGAKAGAKPTGPTLWRGRIEGRGQIELLINGNQIVGRDIGGGGGGGPGGSLGAGTFTMTGDGKSGNMDAVYTDGPRAGETCLGIYKLDGDSLIWCVNNRGGRPQSLNGGNGNWLLTLTRVQMN
jgi:uncharacterized protein (TIGR03067 family)